MVYSLDVLTKKWTAMMKRKTSDLTAYQVAERKVMLEKRFQRIDGWHFGG